MKQIPLTRGKFALVDDEDYDRLVAMGKWHYDGRYACRRAHFLNAANRKTSKPLRMHRLIAFGDGVVDHIDGNPLNNQKTNLRVCSQSQNMQNTRTSKANTSGYRGVSWNKHKKKWESYIQLNGAKKRLGCFRCKDEAALAYNSAALEYRGKFAKLNKIITK